MIRSRNRNVNNKLRDNMRKSRHYRSNLSLFEHCIERTMEVNDRALKQSDLRKAISTSAAKRSFER